jgi:large subunit ribosomal protein L11
LKSPPTAFLIKKYAGVQKGSSTPHTDKVGTLTRDQVRDIAKIKMPDLNAIDMEGAMRQIEGTARNMGIIVND